MELHNVQDELVIFVAPVTHLAQSNGGGQFHRLFLGKFKLGLFLEANSSPFSKKISLSNEHVLNYVV